MRLEAAGDTKQESTVKGLVPELTGGDQLEVKNVEQALSEIKLTSLYSSTAIDLGKSSEVAQLYFGPGFEDRLELEMEE